MAQRFSLIPELIDGIVAGLRARTGFRDPSSAESGITVYDGPEWIGGQDTDLLGFVVIGYGGEDLESRGVEDAPNPMPQSTEIRAISPAAVKEQDVEVPCVAYFWSGDGSVSTVRAGVFAIVAQVEQWLSDNPKCGVAVQADNAQVIHATATGSHEFRQYVDPGPRAVVEFTITAKTRT